MSFLVGAIRESLLLWYGNIHIAGEMNPANKRLTAVFPEWPDSHL